MASHELAVRLAAWAMRVEHTRAQAASYNIATANVGGTAPVATDFEARLDSVRRAATRTAADPRELDALLTGDLSTTVRPAASGGVALDDEVADLAQAEQRYKAIAEALSRQFGLLSLAVSGKQ